MNVMKVMVINTDNGFVVYVITSIYGQATYIGFKSKADAISAKENLESLGPFLATRYPGYAME